MDRGQTVIPQSALDEVADAKGIDIHHGRFRLRFTYQGVKCSETLKGLKLTKENAKYAKRKREAILYEIECQTFDYRAHFPDSSRANLLGKLESTPRTVDDGVSSWLASKEVKMAKSTYRGYKSKAKKVLEHFFGRLIKSVGKAEMENFQTGLIQQGYSTKYVNDILTIARGVWRDAHIDGIVEKNIMEAIQNFELATVSDEAEPFSKDELQRIAATPTKRQSEVNMIMFDCWVGLSISELIAIAWEDVDLERWTVRVRRALVDAEWKVPKERARERTVEIIHAARPWLVKQLQISSMLEPITIKVRQRDNVSTKNESIKPVFINTLTGSYFANDMSVSTRFLKDHLKKARVPYRAANQCRHTFASQMLSHFVSQDWIIRQLGHSDYTMLHRNYGRFITQDTPLLADIIYQQLGTEMSQADLECVRSVSQNSLKVVK
jgi:integrase